MARKRNRFEEEILSPMVRDYLAARYEHVKCEIRIPLAGWRAGAKRVRSIRLDVVATDAAGKELVLVETKAACYPQIIGMALGELMLYERILLENKDAVSAALARAGFPRQHLESRRLYCAFPDMDYSQTKWDEAEATAAFHGITGGRVGLLLVRQKPGPPLKWGEIRKKHLEVIER